MYVCAHFPLQAWFTDFQVSGSDHKRPVESVRMIIIIIIIIKITLNRRMILQAYAQR